MVFLFRDQGLGGVPDKLRAIQDRLSFLVLPAASIQGAGDCEIWLAHARLTAAALATSYYSETLVRASASARSTISSYQDPEPPDVECL